MATDRFPINMNIQTIHNIIESGTDINKIYYDSRCTLLSHAAKHGHADIVQYLIKSGANVNLANQLYNTPLHLASENGHLDIVKLLVESDSDSDNDMEAVNVDGQTPLHMAVIEGHYDVIVYLLSCGADITCTDSTDNTLLHSAVCTDNINIPKYIIDKCKPLINCTNNEGQTPLHDAIWCGNLDMIICLIANGANVNEQDNGGWSSLHLVASMYDEGDYNDIVKYLVDHGAIIDIPDKRQRTPLYIAIRSKSLNIVKFLVDNGANVNHVDADNTTPLIDAARGGKLEIVKYLLDSGAYKEHANKVGITAAQMAKKNKHDEIAEYIESFELILVKGVFY